MKQFYLHDGRHKHGPYFPEELQQFHITRQTSVFAADVNKWMSAGEIHELNSLFLDKKLPAAKWKRMIGFLNKHNKFK